MSRQLFVVADEGGRVVAAHHVADVESSDGGVTVRLMARTEQREYLVELPPALARIDPHDALAALHREYRVAEGRLARKEEYGGV